MDEGNMQQSDAFRLNLDPRPAWRRLTNFVHLIIVNEPLVAWQNIFC